VVSYKEFGKALKVNASGSDLTDTRRRKGFPLPSQKNSFLSEWPLADFTLNRSSLGSDWGVTDLR